MTLPTAEPRFSLRARVASVAPRVRVGTVSGTLSSEVVLPERMGCGRAERQKGLASGHPSWLYFLLGHSVPPPECLFYGHRRARCHPCFSGPVTLLHPHRPALPHDFAFCNIVSTFGVVSTKWGRSGMEEPRMVVVMDV